MSDVAVSEQVSKTGLIHLGFAWNDRAGGMCIDLPSDDTHCAILGDVSYQLMVKAEERVATLLNYGSRSVIGWAVFPMPINTMDDVCRLLAALGVPLKEGR